MAKKITEKQQEILNFIKEEIKKHGYPPTTREICDGVGLKSTSSVYFHLVSLEEKGYIYRDPTKPRAIRLHKDTGMLRCAILQNENVIGHIDLSEEQLNQLNCIDGIGVVFEAMTE